MARRHKLGAGIHAEVEKAFELNLAVAQYIGVGRPCAFVFVQKISKDALPVCLLYTSLFCVLYTLGVEGIMGPLAFLSSFYDACIAENFHVMR